MRKRHVVLTAGLMVMAAGPVLGMAAAPKKEGQAALRIGVFDSRMVALAWGRSQAFLKQLHDMRVEYDKAKTRGDTKRVRELDQQGPKLQDHMHRQVFGNEPIDDVLKKIEKDLPKIAKSAGVDVIVSKWEIVYQAPSAKFEDVTWPMVNLFKPDEGTIKILKEVPKHEPLSSEALDKLHVND